MKKTTAIWFSIPVVITFLLFTGCVKDTCTDKHTYTYYRPVYKTTAEVRANIKSNSPRQVQTPGKIYIRGNYIFLNELNRGIHVINNANPSNPVNIAFIDIPGNIDIAVKGNTLYADLYTDLVTIDITDPLNVAVKKFTEDIFPERAWGGGYVASGDDKIVVDWIKNDTTITSRCDNGNPVFAMEDAAVFGGPLLANAAAMPSGGMGGSMARFAVVNNYLYTVNFSDLTTFNISNSNDPSYVNKKQIGWNIETIFPFKNELFVGSTTGMFIFSISNPGNPTQTGQFSHVRSCDPVIADDNHAYVTLRSGTPCEGFSNQLEVLALNSLTNPVHIKTYDMTNPHGLSKDGNTLFICDGSAGLKIYNASNVSNLQLQKLIMNIEPYDVIAYNNNALVVAKDGLYQYDYSNLNDIKLRSKIEVAR